MSIRIFTGLPATGKTSSIIKEMKKREADGGQVVLLLSSEHEELTRRPNVKPGGMMGCRVPGLSFEIDHVVDTAEAKEILEGLSAGSLAVFDEAQFFQPHIVNYWQKASERQVEILVGTPSAAQLKKLRNVAHELCYLQVDCSCGSGKATKVIYGEDLVYPEHVCVQCYEERMASDLKQLLADVKEAKPFPGDLHTYQPFFDIEMKGWDLVREDSPQRLEIIMDAVERCKVVTELLDNHIAQPSFIDLGCCSGFFCDGMTHHGFRSSGVDVDSQFIEWGSRLARIKGQSINLTRQDLLKFLYESPDDFDVISTFATVQWVMAQQGYEAGLKCFDKIFEKTRSICIVEMGYTTEDIYHDKISDRPREIDRDWVLRLMDERGSFKTIEVHPAGEKGIWRDIFVGFKEVPTPKPFREVIPAEGLVQISNTSGYWKDSWTSQTFDVYLRSSKDIGRISLTGWRPNNSETTEVRMSLAANTVAVLTTTDGLFTLEADVGVRQNQPFRLSVTTTVGIDAPDDNRDLAFVMRSIETD